MTVAGSVFLSCDPNDGLSSARWIADQLVKGDAPVQCWLPETNLSESDDPIGQVSEAIQSCPCFVFVQTKGAIKRGSRAAEEWRLALRYKKPIIIATVEDCNLPPQFERRLRIQIDETKPIQIERLRDAILVINTTEGRLATAKHYLKDAEEAAAYASPENRARISLF
jgi:hypothetical protein